MSTVTFGDSKNVPFPKGSTLANVRKTFKDTGGSLCVVGAPDQSGTLVLDEQVLVLGTAYEFKTEFKIPPLKEQKKETKAPEKVQDLLAPNYLLLDYLGGAHCEVFSAFARRLDTMVAVKFAPIGAAYQLSREAYVLGELADCSGVPKLIEKITSGGYFILVEQPVGEVLSDYSISQSGLLELGPKLLEILCQIHTKNIVHRDIKPSNIIVTPTGEPVIIDFGLAAYTKGQRASGFEGTVDYASQNALDDEPVGPKDDFQSLCYTLYALEIGEQKWISQIKKRRPSVDELAAKSKVISRVCQLWETRRKELKRKKGFENTKNKKLKC